MCAEGMGAESVGVEDMGEEMSAEDISAGDMGVVGFEIPGAAPVRRRCFFQHAGSPILIPALCAGENSRTFYMLIRMLTCT